MEIEIYIDGAWRRCATIEIQPGGAGGRADRTRLIYDAHFARTNLGEKGHRALSELIPVTLGPQEFPTWPSFLVDLLPQGAARRRIEIDATGAQRTEWQILQMGATNPVGNLRIRRPEGEEDGRRINRPFQFDQLTERADAFLDEAYRLGVTIAGASDTQGEAPKFWVADDGEGRWYPDSGQLDAFARYFYLLKFPTPDAGVNASKILRTEAAYQRVARSFGLRTTEALPEYINDALLIPRFDRRRRNDGIVERLGVESIYSLTGKVHSENLTHAKVLLALSLHVDDFSTELCEYVSRDVLNLALGNRDNHGRNTALLKDVDGSVRLTPVYDCGPVHLDARGIVRTTRWPGEPGAAINWQNAIDDLADRFDDAGRPEVFDKAFLADHLRRLSQQVRELPEIMHASGVDEDIVDGRRRDIETLAASLGRVDAPRPKLSFGL